MKPSETILKIAIEILDEENRRLKNDEASILMKKVLGATYGNFKPELESKHVIIAILNYLDIKHEENK